MRLICLMVSAMLVVLLDAPGFSADPSPPPDRAQFLKELLRSETREPVDRRDLLSAVRKTPFLSARWQSGYVLLHGEWHPFEMARVTGEALALREEYLQRRAKADGSADGHFRLAEWCRRKKLPTQEYAHSLAGILLSPDRDHRERLTRLGYRFTGDVWLSPEDVAEWQAQIELANASLEKWGEKLAQVAEQLQSKGRRRDAAFRTLDQLRDATAVPALEWCLCGGDEGTALVAIDRLKHIELYESTKALARQALFNKWPRVREASTEALFDRKLEDFVPDLLSLLSTPFELNVQVVADHRQSTLYYNYILARETEDQFQLAVLETSARFVDGNAARSPQGAGPRRDENLSSPGFQRVRTDLERTLAVESRALEKSLENKNERTQELNGRVADVLVSVSGEEKRETPREWWDWWDNYNDYPKKPKKVRKSQRKRKLTAYGTGNPDRILLSPQGIGQRRGSCLVAGTLVWTDNGTVPVEQLQTGDQLLSQDIETGALCYLPVLDTTVREPTDVFHLVMNSEELTANGGHRFWVPGEGWRRVNDLAEGMLLHTATGSVALTSKEPAGKAAVYNVVVSPTHNYFVGSQALLTHDVTIPRSTNRRVPGLAEP